jgi:hypothetical protein
MTCYKKATACAATVRKGYSTAGQYNPFACQQELTLQQQHDSLYACLLCGNRLYANRTAQDHIQTEGMHGG